MKKHGLFVFSILAFLLIASASVQGQNRPGGYGPGRPGQNGAYVGDQTKGYISGNVVLTETDGSEVPGAGVIVIVAPEKKDTMYTTVNAQGTFFMGNVPVGNARVTFSMMGYEELSNVVMINPGQNRMIANLKAETTQLDAAVLKETVAPISVIKDTIVFHASAVKVNKGENAIDILEQMPGVEVSESGVKVLNEDVKNVYVDGALLFGNAPMKALTNLAAEEVVTISSYQEYANKDPHHKISKTEEKERVLNVATKSHPKFVATGDFIAGGGFDTDSTYHKFRYTFGGNVNLNSEKLQANVSYNLNNINNASNSRRGNSFRSAGGGGGGSADLKALNISAGINKKWMSPKVKNYVLGSIGGNYSYTDKYDVNESITQMVYFPSDKFESREVNRTSYSDVTSKEHNFSVNGMKALPDGSITANASYSLNEGLTNSRNTNYNIQNGGAPQGTSDSSVKNSDGHSYNMSLNANKGFADKFRVRLNGDFSESFNDNFTAKEDTTTSTITYKVININGNGTNRRWSVGSMLRYEIDDNRNISVNYSYSDTYRVTEQLAYDVTDPALRQIDTVNTQRYTTANNTHSAYLDFNNYFDKLKGNLLIRLEYASTMLDRAETFPGPDGYDRRFNSFRPMVSFNRQTMINSWNFSYNSSASTPSLEQVRPMLDNTNLYSVTSGNPLLQQSRSHNFSGRYSTILGEAGREMVRELEEQGRNNTVLNGEQVRSMNSLSTFSVDANFSVTTDPIVRRQIYYAEETYLPEYYYTMPAQSTFTTYENVSNSYSATFNVRYGTPIEKIMCMLSASASMSFDSSPSYVDYILTRTYNYRPSVRLGLRSNFSRYIRLNLNANGSYVYSSNSEKDATKYFTETLSLGWEFNNLLKICYLGGNYYKCFTQGLEIRNVNDNILNVNAGVRFGPRNNFDLSVSVHDLFNKTTGFSTSMNSNYVTNAWRHNFGRYVMFTLAYRFNTMKGQGGQGGPGGGRGMGGPGGFAR